jgi:2-keto-4-pentenoate hydratase/2-oxohepta-3-ene-1,7-dioic acid hydratase in catechol pathway
MPESDVALDYEAELLIVIGRAGRRLSEQDAVTIIGGYACFNDVSERKAQRGDGQWFRGKSHDTFGPFGPWVVTPDEVGDPNALYIRSTVNGEVRQDSNTADMIFKVPEIVSYCSHAFSLEPGDVIATGTPEGVGARDGRYLSVGDTVTVEVEKLGALTNRIIG